MRRLRPAVAGLVAIALIGTIVLVAIRPPTETWANGVFCATLLVLGLAATGGTFLRGRDRAYWAGFALFGWGYLVLVLGPWCEANVAPRLITETALKAMQARYGPYPVTQMSVRTLSEQVRYAPRQVGHALAALLLGLLGGAVAQGFAIAGGVARVPPSAGPTFHRP